MSKTNSGPSEKTPNPGQSRTQLESLETLELPDKEYIKALYCGPSFLSFKIGTLIAFDVQFYDAPPSPTVCFELCRNKTKETRDLNYIKIGERYYVIYTLYETGSYHINIKVNGKKVIAFPSMGHDNESFQETLIKTTNELFTILQEVSVGNFTPLFKLKKNSRNLVIKENEDEQMRQYFKNL